MDIPLYAGAVELTPGAQMDDGQLDVAIFLGRGRWPLLIHFLGVIARSRGNWPDRRVHRARSVRIVAQVPLPVHVDAEPFGTTPIDVEVCPHALRLLVPPSAPAALFRDPGVPIGEESG